jgi:hypothetical protein
VLRTTRLVPTAYLSVSTFVNDPTAFIDDDTSRQRHNCVSRTSSNNSVEGQLLAMKLKCRLIHCGLLCASIAIFFRSLRTTQFPLHYSSYAYDSSVVAVQRDLLQRCLQAVTFLFMSSKVGWRCCRMLALGHGMYDSL